MTNKKRSPEEVYFFAQDKELARYYDDVEGLINPYLNVVTDMIVELLVKALELSDAERHCRQPSILVVGSGTGGEVLPIARRVPHARIMAIDFSAPMNEQMERKYLSEFSVQHMEDSLILLREDFLSDECLPERLAAALKSRFSFGQVDVAVIGFVTHHYALDQKREFYNRTRSLLRPGGSLIHADLFNFRSKWLSRLAHDIGESWTRNQLTNPHPEHRLRFEKIRHVAPRLRDAWIDHWNNTHVYSVLDDGASRDHGADNEPGQMEMLRQLGFSEVECPLRLWEMGLIWARL